MIFFDTCTQCHFHLALGTAKTNIKKYTRTLLNHNHFQECLVFFKSWVRACLKVPKTLIKNSELIIIFHKKKWLNDKKRNMKNKIKIDHQEEYLENQKEINISFASNKCVLIENVELV